MFIRNFIPHLKTDSFDSIFRPTTKKKYGYSYRFQYLQYLHESIETKNPYWGYKCTKTLIQNPRIAQHEIMRYDDRSSTFHIPIRIPIHMSIHIPIHMPIHIHIHIPNSILNSTLN